MPEVKLFGVKISKVSKDIQEYAEKENVLKMLKNQNKPLSLLELKRLGVDTGRRILRQLESEGFISKEEVVLNNCSKTYMDKEDKKVKNVSGSKFYVYEFVRDLS